MKQKKQQEEIKVTFEYIEPKTKEEAEDAKRRLHAVFDILFEGIPLSEDLKQDKENKTKL